MNCHPKSYSVGIALAVFLALSLPAQASVLNTYTDRANFDNATSNRTLITFDGTTPQSWVNAGYTNYYGLYSDAAGLTLDGVNFVGNNGSGGYQLYTSNPSDPNASENYGTGTVLKGPEYYPTSSLLITLPGATTAFGFDLGAMLPSVATFNLELVSLGVNYSVTTQLRPNLTFFGVTLDAPTTQIRLTTTQGTLYQTQLLLDNFAYGTAGAGAGQQGAQFGGPTGETPEVTTLLYVASGLGLLAWKRRRAAAFF